MQIGKQKVVAIDYKLTDDSGEQIDSSEGRDPLYYLHGADNIIPGLEQALDGKSAGDELNVTIAPEDAYGPHRQEMIQVVAREELKALGEIQLGAQFQVPTNHGALIVTVIEMDDENVTLDGNHALAGKTLTFDVTVKEVRDATEEELAHGHVHGPGGVQH